MTLLLKFQTRNLLKTALTGAVVLLALLGGGCSSHKHSVRSHRTKHHPTAQERIMERELQKFLKGNELRIISESFEWLGTPYAFGMQNKGEGTDCSGMVMVIYNDIAGCKLPRNSAQQAEYCLGLETDDKVKAGDLVFFITNSGDKINHVGIMIDETQFIHASSKGVVISSMETSYYQTHFRSFGRVPCLGD